MTQMTRLVSLAVVTLLIIFLGITFFHVIAPFLLPLFLAGVVAMLAQPMQTFFEKKTKNRTHLAAGLTTGSVILGISVPVVLGVSLATLQISLFVGGMLKSNDWSAISQKVRQELHIDNVVERLQPYVSEQIDADKLQAEIQKNVRAGLELLVSKTGGVAGQAVGLIGGLVSMIVQLLTFVIALYYFLADGPAFVAASESLIPVAVEYQRGLRLRFYNVVRAVVLATFLAAIGQGFANATVLWFFGFRQFVILFILATFASMVPFFGTWLVWGPCMVWLALQGSWVSATLLLVIGVGFIGMLDNIIRTFVLQSDAQLHPLLAFICVLGGVQVMGLWGVFIAPIVAAILHALIVIFNTEVTELSHERRSENELTEPDCPPEEACEDSEAKTQPPTEPEPESESEEAEPAPEQETAAD